MRVVGLTGKAGAGKNYISKHVLAPAGYMPLALAGPMKAELAGQGVIPFLEAAGIEPKSPRTRSILQVYGTELGRERFHQDVWCWNLRWWMEWFAEEAGIQHFVITDVRFPNEAEFVQALGGMIIRVEGRGGLVGEAAKHKSETALDFWMFPTVFNYPGTPTEELRKQVFDHIENHPWPHGNGNNEQREASPFLRSGKEAPVGDDPRPREHGALPGKEESAPPR